MTDQSLSDRLRACLCADPKLPPDPPLVAEAAARIDSLSRALQAYGDGGSEGPSIAGFIDRIGELEREVAEKRELIGASDAELRERLAAAEATQESFRKVIVGFCDSHISIPVTECPTCDRDALRERLAAAERERDETVNRAAAVIDDLKRDRDALRAKLAEAERERERWRSVAEEAERDRQALHARWIASAEEGSKEKA